MNSRAVSGLACSTKGECPERLRQLGSLPGTAGKLPRCVAISS